MMRATVVSLERNPTALATNDGVMSQTRAGRRRRPTSFVFFLIETVRKSIMAPATRHTRLIEQGKHR